MIIASAQTNPKREDIKSNIKDHCDLIELAAKNGADLILFPEMSITGYERDKAMSLAFIKNDNRLEKLKNLSRENQIVVIAGAPIWMNNDLFIGAYIIKPDDSVSIYTKQFLHREENIFFLSSFDYNPVIKIENELISIAICSDINNSKHPENASKAGTTLYLASIFFESCNMKKAFRTLSNYADKYSMNVLMSNYTGRPWGLDGGGQSGFWDKNGKLIARLNGKDPGILLIEQLNDQWTGKSSIIHSFVTYVKKE